MTNPMSGPPPASSGKPYLNGSQRERVHRAREVVGMDSMDIAAGEHEPFASAYALGVMRSNVHSLLDVIDELTGGPASDAVMAQKAARLEALLKEYRDGTQ